MKPEERARKAVDLSLGRGNHPLLREKIVKEIQEAERDARAAERKPMECGHPQACFTLGEPGPDIPFCSVCKDVADAGAKELKRCCDAIRAECGTCEGTGHRSGVDVDGCPYEGSCDCERWYAAIRERPAESEDDEASGWLYNCGHCKRQLTEKELGPNSVEAATCSGNGTCPWCLYSKVWRIKCRAPVTSEVRAALSAAINNADKPRAGSEAAAAIEQLRKDRRLTREELDRPCMAESGDGHKCAKCGDVCECNKPDGECEGCCQGSERACRGCDECRGENAED